MNRIESTVNLLKQNKQKVLAGYFMVGEFSNTLEIMHEGSNAGLDIIELGLPFSDPTADGETIQQSGKIAMNKGTCTNDAFEVTRLFRQKNTTTPIILMGYFNIVFCYGMENFAKKCYECGADGLIIVDLPIEESSEFERVLSKYNIIIIQVVSFLTPSKRFIEIQKRARGFIYLISTLGVTGKALPMVQRIQDYLGKIDVRVPVLTGFGISSPKSAKEISQYCDGVIVGSYLINVLREGGTPLLSKNVKAIKNAIT